MDVGDQAKLPAEGHLLLMAPKKDRHAEGSKDMAYIIY